MVAGGVVVLMRRGHRLRQPWLLVPLAYGFWARVLTGPTLSPLGQLATRVVAPRLRVPARPVPGPPKRFAQAMGVVFSTTALVLWFGVGAHGAAWVVVGLLAVAALLESAFGVCLGCKVFSALMRVGLIPRVGVRGVRRHHAASPRTAAGAGRGLKARRRRGGRPQARRGTSSPISTDSSRAQST